VIENDELVTVATEKYMSKTSMISYRNSDVFMAFGNVGRIGLFE